MPRQLEKGEKGNIISYRIGGDPVDKALNRIHDETKIPVQEIVRKSIVNYEKTLYPKTLKRQRREG